MLIGIWHRVSCPQESKLCVEHFIDLQCNNGLLRCIHWEEVSQVCWCSTLFFSLRPSVLAADKTQYRENILSSYSGKLCSQL